MGDRTNALTLRLSATVRVAKVQARVDRLHRGELRDDEPIDAEAESVGAVLGLVLEARATMERDLCFTYALEVPSKVGHFGEQTFRRIACAAAQPAKSSADIIAVTDQRTQMNATTLDESSQILPIAFQEREP